MSKVEGSQRALNDLVEHLTCQRDEARLWYERLACERDALAYVLEKVAAERDAALAEVERLKRLLSPPVEEE